MSAILKPGAWEHALDDIKHHEGFRSTAYKDTVGVWTIGYGFTGGVRAGDTITREEADQYLERRVTTAVQDVYAVLGTCFNDLDAPRQAVMINMCYNLGRRGLSKFVGTIQSLCNGDYQSTASHMTGSLWCRQVKGRCTDLTKAMQAGAFLRW